MNIFLYNKNKVNEFIRKVTILFLFFLCVGNYTYASEYENNELLLIQQINTSKVTITISNKTVDAILDAICKQAKVQYVFSSGVDIDKTPNYSLNVKNVTVADALTQLLKDTKYSYAVDGNKITIKYVVKAPVVNKDTKISVKGNVLDASKKPIIGATVVVLGTTTGCITNEEGQFIINTTANSEIEISFTGKLPQVKVLTDSNENLTIVMQDDVLAVEDVIVTGIFNRRAGSFTGSANTLKAEDLKRVGNQNVLASLRNIDPSLMIMDNMEFGSDPNKNPEMTLRGTSSFDLSTSDIDIKGSYGNDPNAPLFILDGFETSVQKIMDLDMNRVESLTILKDASAKAIYGSKAANGVIVIETKKSNDTKLRITYTGKVDVQMPDLTSYNLTNAAQKLDLERDAGLYVNKYGEFDLALAKKYNDRYTAVTAGVDTDWLAKPLRTGIGNKHSLQLELGDNALRVLADFSYNNIAGVMKGSSRETYEGAISLSYVHKKFKFRNVLTVTSNVAKDSPYGKFDEYAYMNPYYSPNDIYGRITQNAAFSIRGADPNDTEFIGNPLYNAQLNNKIQQKYFDVTNNFYVEWFITQELKATGRFGFTEKNTGADEFYPSNHLKFRQYSNDDFARKGSYQVNDGHEKNLSGDINLQYNKVIKDKHYIFANVGYTLSEKTFEEIVYKAEGFPNDRMTDMMFARQYLKESKPSGRESTIRDIGVLAAINYSYDDRYLFDASYRTSASSQFGANNRWGQFWSTGVGWNLHKESFLKDVEAINNLKIRGSIGHTGSQSGAAYDAMATYYYFMDRTYKGYLGSYLKGMQNKDLKWQQKMDYNIGIDLNIKRRFIVAFDIYKGISKNTLIDLTLVPSTGFNRVKENVGTVTNQGMDLRVTYTAWQRPKDNSYLTFTVNASRNKNTLGGLSNAMDDYNKNQDNLANNVYNNAPVQKYYDGASMDAIWGMKSLGIDPANGREIFLKKDGTPTYAYSASEQVILGDEMPDFQGNFGVSFEYKGFGCNLTLRYQFGAQMYNKTLLDKVENANLSNNVDIRLYDGVWRKQGDIKPYKSMKENYIMNEDGTYEYKKEKTSPTSRFVQNRNELTLANVSLNYDFYRWDFVKKIGMERLKLAFYMNDIFTISSINIERGTYYPFARGFNFSLTATF